MTDLAVLRAAKQLATRDQHWLWRSESEISDTHFYIITRYYGWVLASGGATFGFLTLLFAAAIYAALANDSSLSIFAALSGRIAFVAAFPVAGIVIAILEYWRQREARWLRERVAIRLGLTPPSEA